jgi:hypothetical protein
MTGLGKHQDLEEIQRERLPEMKVELVEYEVCIGEVCPTAAHGFCSPVDRA